VSAKAGLRGAVFVRGSGEGVGLDSGAVSNGPASDASERARARGRGSVRRSAGADFARNLLLAVNRGGRIDV